MFICHNSLAGIKKPVDQYGDASAAAATQNGADDDDDDDDFDLFGDDDGDDEEVRRSIFITEFMAWVEQWMPK